MGDHLSERARQTSRLSAVGSRSRFPPFLQAGSSIHKIQKRAGAQGSALTGHVLPWPACSPSPHWQAQYNLSSATWDHLPAPCPGERGNRHVVNQRGSRKGVGVLIIGSSPALVPLELIGTQNWGASAKTGTHNGGPGSPLNPTAESVRPPSDTRQHPASAAKLPESLSPGAQRHPPGGRARPLRGRSWTGSRTPCAR